MPIGFAIGYTYVEMVAELCVSVYVIAGSVAIDKFLALYTCTLSLSHINVTLELGEN